MNIRDRIAVVTGAAGGIGEATARELTAHGARLVGLVDRDARVERLAEELNAAAGRQVALPLIGDVTSDPFRRDCFARLSTEDDGPTICVPAAGVTRDRLAVKLDRTTGAADVCPIDDFRLVLEVNLIAPIYWSLEMIARTAERRRRRGLGRWTATEEVSAVAVLVGSVSSQGNRGQLAYAASKAALDGATATLASEAIFHGVRCVQVHPGFTDTPMVRALGDDLIARQVLPATRLGRLIRPAEIADAIGFLIRNDAMSGPSWADAGWRPGP